MDHTSSSNDTDRNQSKTSHLVQIPESTTRKSNRWSVEQNIVLVEPGGNDVASTLDERQVAKNTAETSCVSEINSGACLKILKTITTVALLRGTKMWQSTFRIRNTHKQVEHQFGKSWFPDYFSLW